MHNKKFFKNILILLALLVIFCPIGYMYYLYHQLDNIKSVPIPQNDEDLGINPIVYKKHDSTIRNIAFFGIDTGRNKGDIPHSDSVIIVTIDKKREKLKLTSILRDTYVKVEDHGEKKLTEAYSFGGPPLSIKTLNQNFNLDIKDYVTIDFFGLEKIIDTLDGITINVKQYEISEINKWIKELSDLEKKTPIYLKKPGFQQLNGTQAVAYARIRKVGDGDFERSMRQRIVLDQILSKVKHCGITKFPLLVSNFIPMVETSMSRDDIIETGSYLLTSNINTIDQQRFPLDGYCKGTYIKHVWYLMPVPGIHETSKQINDYIYNDIKPMPKEPLF